MDHASRRSRLAATLEPLQAQAILVTRLPNVRYLTGFTGSNAQFLLSVDEAVLFTDGRYIEQSAREAPDLRRSITADGFAQPFAQLCGQLGLGRVAFEADGV